MTDKMTIEQALAYFKHRVSTKGQCGENTTQRYAFEMAIESLEKQIPMKADGVYCNRCGWQVKKFHKVSGQYSGVADGYAYREEKHDYCESCGQAIDWESDTE